MAGLGQEMRRRAEGGQLLPSLHKECVFLEEWARLNYPNQQTPKVKSIENALRTAYRNLLTTS